MYCITIDVEQTLDNIIVCRVFSHEEQMGNFAHCDVIIAIAIALI